MPRPPRFGSLTRALRHRNYRLFFSGQGTSLVGTWITRIATSWLVYRLTGSELLLGVVGFAGQIPTLLLAPFAGVLVDRWNKHRILVVTQVASMLQSLALALLAIPGIITVTHIVLLQLLQGVINAFDTPARQAFLVEMLDDRNDLPNAIALNSSMVNLSRILGPSIGGVLIALVGEGWCFMIDAVSYVAVVASLYLMRLARPEPAPRGTGLLGELREGFAYVSGFAPARTVLLLLALIATMGMPYTVLMPVIAENVLHGGPHTLGVLMSASGAGALLGAVYLAARPTIRGLWRVIRISAATFGAGLIAFSLSTSLPLSLLILAVVGAGMMVSMASVNTILQTMVETRLRGRVMAFYAMAFLGTAPIGSLIAGVVASRLGAPHTIMLGGVACVLGAGAFALVLPRIRPQIREVYAARGVG
ncbi:MAG TPA: MFS transporter [Gemmatimonadales bacterium]|nr:MFS transporter [Gemmatimonadales bacterium]